MEITLKLPTRFLTILRSKKASPTDTTKSTLIVIKKIQLPHFKRRYSDFRVPGIELNEAEDMFRVFRINKEEVQIKILQLINLTGKNLRHVYLFRLDFQEPNGTIFLLSRYLWPL